MECEICKKAFKGSRVGVCSSNAICKAEWQRRTRANPRLPVPCKMCGIPFRGSETGICARSKECKNERQKQQYQLDPEKHRSARRDYSKRTLGSPEQKARVARFRFSRHGVTEEWYDKQLAKQNYRCAICLTTEPGGKGYWQIDHDHRCCASVKRNCKDCTRGLLCNRCNVGIGMLGDSVENLQAAITYLTHYRKEIP